jgi:ferredoxin
MANFTAAINALVAERDRVFLMSVAEQFNLPFEQLSKLYLETAEQAIKVPRKYTKKPKAVAVATEGEAASAESAPAAPKEPKAKAEKQKCTACTSKKEACKFSALKGEVFCKRHLRAAQEANGEAPLKEKVAKKPATKAEQPVHTHALTENARGECELCESHGNPMTEEAEFEVVLDAPQPTLTVAERLAALLEDSDAESDAESEAYADLGDLNEEGFEDDD